MRRATTMREPPAPSSDRGVKATVAISVLVTAAYFGAAKLGLSLAFAHSSVSAIWPPTGIALAAVLLGGYRVLPAIALGAFLANVTTPAPLAAVLGITIGNTLEALVGAALLKRAGFRGSLDRTRDVVAIVALAGVVSTAVSASFGIASLAAFGHLPGAEVPSAWRVWWLGDMGGDLLVATALLVLADTPLSRLRSRAAAEALLLSVALAVVSVVVLRSDGALVYVIFPMLFLLALLYRQRGAVLGGLIVSAIAVWFTARGHGPFAGGSPGGDLVRAQTFVSIGSFEWDVRADRATWSDQLYRIFGLEPNERTPGYRTWRDCVHEEDRATVDAIFETARDKWTPYSSVHRIVRADGNVRTIECHGRVELDATGTAARMVGTAQDITALKLAEERFRSLFENAPDAQIVVDPQGEVVLANSQTERLFGYSRHELTGMPVQRLIPGASAEQQPWFTEPVDPDGGAALGGALELYALRSDGSEFPVEISLTPLITEEGSLVSASVRDVTERKLAAEALAYRASHDPLTGLPNRTLFLDRLAHALDRAHRTQRELAVVFLDLDDFKLVNDSRGHEVGDLLLVALTPRLNAALRPGDTIARFGGDEFVVLCEDLSSEADAIRIAERISDACSDPVVIGDYEHLVTVSAGVVLVSDPQQATASGVLRDADAAMYRAKASGNGQIEVFDEGMRARLIERIAIESSLRRAIERRELRLFYQPVVSLERGGVVGVEALLRWQHPHRGLLEPSEFIDVAERSGLIVQIGEWVLEEACRQAAAWHAAAPGEDAIHVSVNLSPVQIVRSDIAASVARILSATGLDPGLLELEVTERMLFEDGEACARALGELKALGISLVLDDFGTGYSSLSHLKRLTIDALKIDRSFVDGLGRDSESGAIVSAVLSMASALDLRVTAEGVETQGQLSRLRAAGCEYAQGFLFSAPAPAEELEARLGLFEQREPLTA